MLARRAGAYHGRLNEPIAAVSLSYTDDPLVAGVWGSYAMDDEGVAALQRPLIRDGVLVGSLHDRASTVHPGITGGHGRRQSFASPAIPRMSNTFVDAGPDSPMSVTDSVQYGLYVSDSGDGQVDPAAGLFRIGIRQGQLIRNGRLSEPVRDGVVEGSIVTALSSIDGIAADVRLVEGSCRKQSQWVNVSSGNPTMRINGLSVRPAVG
jgi:TldD protein